MANNQHIETYKLSDLIAHLRAIKKEFGDRPVALAKDWECNSYGNVTYKSFEIHDNMLVICPRSDNHQLEEFIDFEETL